MGSSSWSYFVPYQPDLDAALQELRRKVFAEGDYYWVRGNDWTAEDERKPRPSTMDELFADEWVKDSGTHSILDMDHVLDDDEAPDYGTVEPVSAEEAFTSAGTERLTRGEVDAIRSLATSRWFGRCAVLHDELGQPQEIYFWGRSGD